MSKYFDKDYLYHGEHANYYKNYFKHPNTEHSQVRYENFIPVPTPYSEEADSVTDNYRHDNRNKPIIANSESSSESQDNPGSIILKEDSPWNSDFTPIISDLGFG